MQALVVYESMYGNTHAIATDIAAGLRATQEVTLAPVTRATGELVAAADLIVAGGPDTPARDVYCHLPAEGGGNGPQAGQRPSPGP